MAYYYTTDDKLLLLREEERGMSGMTGSSEVGSRTTPFLLDCFLGVSRWMKLPRRISMPQYGVGISKSGERTCQIGERV